METAPLTLAHTHARNAVLETKRSNPVAASEEHDLAATEFAAAAHCTTDTEAGRILRLLEKHHKKLGNILKTRHQTPTTQGLTAEPSTAAQDDVAPKSRTESLDTASQPPRLVRPSRHPARDLSSSIASNLASARGIPSHRQKRSTPISPLVSSQHADGLMSQDDGVREESPRRAVEPRPEIRKQNSSRPSWAPPLDVNPDNTNMKDDSQIDTTVSDAPFQQFYSTFESLLSKLSAPLAFAGLPLSSTPSTPQPTQAPTTKPAPSVRQRATEALQSSVDYSQLISRAALRAVRNDDPRSTHNPSESFYVVPTSGGTTSYADIMSRAEREGARAFRDHQRNFSNASNNEFVDASSTILSPPPSISGGRGRLEPKVDGKTMEELALENQALKHLSDTLSKRLHVFEMSAQTSSAALAQSIRSLHLSPMSTPENSRGKAKTSSAFSPEQIHGSTSTTESAKLNNRIFELEEILRKSDAKVKKREDENAKLRDMLVKYRDKWEGLKAGAKARREKQVQGDSPRKKDRTRTGDDTSTTGTPEKLDQPDDDQDL